MKSLPKKYKWIDIGEDARRQFIDAQSVFAAYELAQKSADEVRGGMYWKKQSGQEYLIKTSPKNAQTSLGVQSEKTKGIYDRFMARKSEAENRLSDLKTEVGRHQRMNRALFVGRAPRVLVDILTRLSEAKIAQHFIVVGTHALYAYESAAGVRFGDPATMATRDADLLWDTRKRVKFVSVMHKAEQSIMGILKKVDPTFKLLDFERHKAVNSKGFEVEIIRREAGDKDPHPLRMTDNEEEFYAVQAKNAEKLLSAPRFSSMIASPSGHMARMDTISPLAFVRFKKWMAGSPDRDPLRRKRDLLQAEQVEELIREYLPHLKDA